MLDARSALRCLSGCLRSPACTLSPLLAPTVSTTPICVQSNSSVNIPKTATNSLRDQLRTQTGDPEKPLQPSMYVCRYPSCHRSPIKCQFVSLYCRYLKIPTAYLGTHTYICRQLSIPVIKCTYMHKRWKIARLRIFVSMLAVIVEFYFLKSLI